MNRFGKFLVAFAAAAMLVVAFAPPSGAVNTRVSIFDFKWSNTTPQIDLGEKVIWDWLGPDLQHSVTGFSDNSVQWDSDPGISMPLHKLGSTFEVAFSQPGQYEFHCKLHSSVRGTVIVSNSVGDPNSDPGPQPPLNTDMEPPFVDGIKLFPTVYGPKRKGGPLEFSMNERGIADADYYRLVKRGKKKKM
ncbi:MAG: plastocyanin/azurin family copper-binding protein, partial [Actinomycetota bacterium]|nr:plastocyanin/azurin family copper-binding protein [Actinomycetota bacterium]